MIDLVSEALIARFKRQPVGTLRDVRESAVMTIDCRDEPAVLNDARLILAYANAELARRIHGVADYQGQRSETHSRIVGVSYD